VATSSRARARKCTESLAAVPTTSDRPGQRRTACRVLRYQRDQMDRADRRTGRRTPGLHRPPGLNRVRHDPATCEKRNHRTGALHHGLPTHWDRTPCAAWDTRPVAAPAVQPTNTCANTFEMLADPGVSRNSGAVHASVSWRFTRGGLEQMTERVGRARADADGASVYLIQYRRYPLPPVRRSAFSASESGTAAEVSTTWTSRFW